jgi:predicted metalloprotease with PDZ domain
VILNETERRYWLGVGLATADDTLRSHLGIASVEGLVVTGVEENSPAAKAGVMINDVLLKVDGKPVTTVEALAAQLQEIGSKSANLELLRRGKPATLTVTPERRPAEHVLLFSAIDRGEDAVKLEHQLGEWLTTRLVLNRDLVVEARLADQKSALEKQIGDLLEQARQLQKSLEALDSALKAQSAAPPAGK